MTITTPVTVHCIQFYLPGGPGHLKYETCLMPDQLGEGQMLIKVSATSVLWTELYWPIYQRKDGTYKPHIPCHDFSGVVVKVGSGFEDSNISGGSEVCAFTATFVNKGEEGFLRQYEGAAAEYAVADRDTAVLKPENMSLLEAALHEHAQLQKGQKLLITGAAGATGLCAVQMAKAIGAHIIGTASSAWSMQTLEQLGVDDIIDCTKHKLEDAVSDVDLILDTVGMTAECAKVVKPDGQIVAIADQSAHEKSANAKFFIVAMKREQLEQVVRLIEKGKSRTFLDALYPLERAADAFSKGAGGHLHGKVMLQMRFRQRRGFAAA